MTDREVFQIQIDNIKEDMNEFKNEVRDHLKEVKETNKVYLDTIGVMKENLVRLTILVEKQDEQLTKQDNRLEKQDNALSKIGQEVSYLRQNIDKSETAPDEDKAWYQGVISTYIKYFMIIIVILLCFVTGYKMDDILEVIK